MAFIFEFFLLCNWNYVYNFKLYARNNFNSMSRQGPVKKVHFLAQDLILKY